jgi:isochorismate synthase
MRAAATEANPAGAGVGLHARTVLLDYGPDALQFDGSPTVLFDRPGLTLVGWGTARLVGVDDAAAALGAIPCDDEVRRPGSGVVALGALPFESVRSGRLVVPRFTMGIDVDAEGVTRRWATAVGPADVPLPTTEELFDAVIWQYGSTAEPAEDAGPGPGPAADTGAGTGARTRTSTAPAPHLTSTLPTEAYRDLVARTVDAMRAPGASLRKVVLSRPLTVALDGELELSAVLRRLRAGEPNCTIFAMPVPDGVFFGASPELLVARHGSRVTAHPLAGTVPRGTTARTDADAQGRLAGSPKDRAEHRFVVDDIADTLRRYCADLDVPAAPSLVAFRSVAHLGTRLSGHLTHPVSVLELVERLHPTPAVGGTPRAEALAVIAAGEPDPRGYWAGPVGWVDAAGDGEWMIGIRSARLHAESNDVILRAGSGVVVESDPDDEAAETNVKLATVLEAVLPGASAQLR